MMKCDRCNKELAPNALPYRVKIQAWGDFDGTISVSPDADLAQELKNAVEKTEWLPGDLIEEEVYREFTFILCRRCKELFCANPLNLSLDRFRLPKGLKPPE